MYQATKGPVILGGVILFTHALPRLQLYEMPCEFRGSMQHFCSLLVGVWNSRVFRMLIQAQGYLVQFLLVCSDRSAFLGQVLAQCSRLRFRWCRAAMGSADHWWRPCIRGHAGRSCVEPSRVLGPRSATGRDAGRSRTWLAQHRRPPLLSLLGTLISAL